MVAVVAYWKAASQSRIALAERDLVARAQSAITGFAYTKFRLPCPATSTGNGVEDCTGAGQANLLPWRTLGLPDGRAKQIRYGVYRKPSSTLARLDTDLAVARDRSEVLMTVNVMPTSTPLGQSTLLGNTNLLDFCSALSIASAASFDARYLHTVDANAAKQNVAFALALPGLLDADGDGDKFDGFQSTQSAAMPAFNSPSTPQTDLYDDKVSAVAANTLFGALSCGLGLSATNHSHFNALNSVRAMEKGFYDYETVLSINLALSIAGAASGASSALIAAAGVLSATAALSTGIGDSILSYGAKAAGAISAAIAVVVSIIAAASTTAAIILADAVVVAMGFILGDFKSDIKPLAKALADDMERNARRADALGL
jgi:hypothetical protein